MPFFNWSKTASSNANDDPTINWAEGMAPSAINDSARATMAALKAWGSDTAGSVRDTGTGTAFVVTSNQGFDTLAHMDGAVVAFVPANTNTGTSTLAVDGLAAKPLRSAPSVEISPNVLAAGAPYSCTYNNTDGAFYLHNCYLLGNTIGGAGSSAGSVSGTATQWAFSAYYSPNSTAGAIIARVDHTSAPLIQFNYASGVTSIGNITTTGTAVAYNTSSDKRLKIYAGQLDATAAFDNICAVRFDWKSSGEKDVGFFAQDVQPWAPNAVTEGRGEPGAEDFASWKLDYSKLVPYLWAEVSRLRDKVAELELVIGK